MTATTRSVSFYFYAGDFAEAMRRHAAGEQQVYATHSQVAQLMNELADDGHAVTVHSYQTPEAKVESPRDGVRIVSLGAQEWNADALLLAALASDTSDTLVPHFPNQALVKGCLDTGRPVMLGMADSFNRTGLRGLRDRYRLMRVLGDSRLPLIANHCWPATQQLAKFGIDKRKLVPWDIPKSISPEDVPAKTLAPHEPLTIAYAGSVTEAKGVGDVLRAVAILKDRGVTVTARLAGSGDVPGMQALAARLGIAEQVSFLGVIGNADVNHLFRTSSLVAVPSRHDFPEGFPLTMFEAIASRTPIVCSDHPMFVPVLGHSKRAGIFREKNPASLASAVGTIVNDPGLYARMSANAQNSWADLTHSADWRTLMLEYVRHGARSPWIQARTFDKLEAQLSDPAGRSAR